jgi:ribosomal protein L10
MARPEKTAAVAEIVESFNGAAGAVLTEYRGLTVKELQDLRRSLGENANYAVVKNTLAKIAATEVGIEGFDDLLTGPTAIAFINGDVVEAAKGLRDFAKANPALVIKGGVLDGNTLDASEVAKLADLESREVLLGKMAGAMLASLPRPSTSSTPRSHRLPGSPAPCRRRPRRTPRSSQVVPVLRRRRPLTLPPLPRTLRPPTRRLLRRRPPRPRRRGDRRGDRVHRGLTGPTYTT